ncbi:MAG: tetratricopeptide repeat protein [Sedimenticolaceae bacterium]
MSLLNQVLQDLDARAPAAVQHPVRRAEAPAVVDPDEELLFQRRPDWRQLVIWSLVGAAVMLWAWRFIAVDNVSDVPTAAQPPVAAVDLTPSLNTSARRSGEVLRTADEPKPSAAAAPTTAEVSPIAQDPTSATAAGPVAEGDTTPSGPYLPLRNTVLPQAADTPATRGPSAATGEIKIAKSAVVEPLADARMAIARGDLAEAETLLQQHLQRASNDLAARELLIGLMLRGNRHAAAIAQLDQGLLHHPRHLKFVMIKARLLAQNGDTAAAIQLLESSPVTGRDGVQLRQMLGAMYQQLGRYEEAVENYRTLLAFTPSAGPAWVGLAISLDALGDAEAPDAYRRALVLGGLPVPAAAYARQRIAQLGAPDG